MFEIDQILRCADVLEARGRSRSSHYEDITQGLFTKPVKIGLRAVGWPASDVAVLNAARIAGRSRAEIRKLVEDLESHRTAACISASRPQMAGNSVSQSPSPRYRRTARG